MSVLGLAIDARQRSFSAIEAFILARLFMFQQVYSTRRRAAEWMTSAARAP